MPGQATLGDLSRRAVLRAIAECDRLGRDAFLAEYGFRKAREYFLVHEGRRYDSKAIAGVAHKFEHGRPLQASEFTGGAATVWRILTRLGFDVEGAELTGADARPTADEDALMHQVSRLLKTNSGPIGRPPGQAAPKKLKVQERYEFERCPRVVVFVLRRANGTCESCGAEAPFLREDGSPYLEVHHITRLADGGEDTTYNAAAVCANCHRALHFAKDRTTRTRELRKRIDFSSK